MSINGLSKTDPRDIAAVPIGAVVTLGHRRGVVTRYINEQPVVAWEGDNEITAHNAADLTITEPAHQCGPDCTPDNCENARQEYVAQREAIDQAHRQALTAHQHWAHIAEILTELRAHGTAGLVDLPDIEEWWEPSGIGAPFDIEELRGELAALSGPITKAHTLAVIYRRRADEFDEWLTENPDPSA